MTPWRQALEVARYDLMVERRAKETVTVALPFGLTALVAVALAVGADLPLIAEMGPSLFWSLGMLFGMQIAWRQSLADSGPIRDLFALLGIVPPARFWGRTLASALLMTGFMGAMGLATVLFFSSRVPWSPWSLLIVLLFASGLAMISTLASDLTAGISGRSPLAALVVAPLALPLMVGAAQGMESLTRGRGILSWLMMLAAADLVLAVAGTVAARPLSEASR
jgi:heme exporter protein B